jgi:tetraacyldisaccharide 4'-kinase
MADSGKVQPPTKIPNALTRAMSWGYRLGIGFQNWRFDRGFGVTRLDVPVISIGNLSAGGTGKTPMVHWVANELQTMGKKPAIAMRGYKAPPGEMGDEEREHHEALPDVSVVAQPNRLEGLQALFETDPMDDCVILDDGFQHRQIARDVDIVLIDASHPPYEDAILPRGYLRDPVSSLARADAIVITHREMVRDDELAELVGWIKSQVPGCPVAVASHEWDSVTTYTSNEGRWDAQKMECEHFAGKRILGMCAIGNPAGFFAQIHALGWDLVEEIELPDHYAMDDDEIGWLCSLASKSKADAVCMTRKDWVKAGDLLAGKLDLPVVVPELVFRFESGADLIRSLIREPEET